MGSGSPGVPCPLIHMEQPWGLAFSCPLWSCFVRCDLGSPGQLAAAGQEKPVSCACSQERSYVASIFASSSGEGQGSGAMYPGSQRKLIPIQSVKARLLVAPCKQTLVHHKKELPCLLVSMRQRNSQNRTKLLVIFVIKFVIVI